MAEIQWWTPGNGKPLPKGSTFRPSLVLLVSTFYDALDAPAQAPFLVSRCIEQVQQDLQTRRREEDPKTNKDANDLKWAWWRFVADGKNLRILKNAIYEQTQIQPEPMAKALQDLASITQVVIDELVKANEIAPQLNPRKPREDEALPVRNLPEAPKVVNYGDLLEGNGGNGGGE